MTYNQEKWKWINGGVAAPIGFYANGVHAGIRKKGKYDIAVVLSETAAQAAGVFTRNKVKAHPLLLTQKHLLNGQAQAIVVNSGNANACVGEAGDKAALAMAQETAASLGLPVEDVLVASTGVIGVEMPVDTVITGISMAAAELKEHQLLSEDGLASRIDGARRAALAIMTTDTTMKECAFELPCQGGTIRLGAMAKGSGMIHPNMGTMLGFLTTDACVSAPELQRLLRLAVEESFNMVTVDGDTSTNDMVLFLANGASGITPSGEDWEQFEKMVRVMCTYLAKEIARDGEGASKFLEVYVKGAKTINDARLIAKSICGSSLVKTAVFGEDANWGRILAAAGYSGADFNPAKADISIGDIYVAQRGHGIVFSEEAAGKNLQQKEIKITVDLHNGCEEATAWGCDLTHQYVTINGSYRT